MCLQWLRNEFTREKLSLRHGNIRDLTSSKWLSKWCFVSWRVLSALYLFITLILVFVRSGARTLIFVTNWSYIVLTVYFIFAAVLSVRYLRSESQSITTNPEEGGSTSQEGEGGRTPDDPDTGHAPVPNENIGTEALPLIFRIFWVFFYAASTASFVASLIYWSVLSANAMDGNSMDIFINFTTHLFNCIFMFIENAFCSVPMRFVHFVIPVIYFAVYGTFTIIYWAAGGIGYNGASYIYPVFDYADAPGVAAGSLVALLLVVVPGCFTLHYLLHKLRCRLLSRSQENAGPTDGANVVV